jgi:G:T-mismatch repair DNA endonuclease (very short patch repair protein)
MAKEGHVPWNKGKHGIYSPETIEKIRQAQLGKPSPMNGKHHSEESKEKNRQAHLGKPGSFKGKHHSLETRKKLSEAAHQTYLEGRTNPRKGVHLSEETKKKLREANIGKHASEESRKKMSEAGLGKKKSIETRRKMSESAKHRSPEHLTKMSETRRKRWQDPEYREKVIKSLTGRQLSETHLKKIRELWQNSDYIKRLQKSLHSKTKPEKRVDMILQQLYPGEFKYNGRYDSGISVDGLIPDFVDVKGQNKAIDIHGSYWHKDEDMAARSERYAKHGYSLLIIWEDELKDGESIIRKIVEFVGKEPYFYFENT